jgi:hypothetical protein
MLSRFLTYFIFFKSYPILVLDQPGSKLTRCEPVLQLCLTEGGVSSVNRYGTLNF